MDRRVFLGLGVGSVVACAGRRPAEPASPDGKRWLRLSSNENPLGMSPHAREAVLQRVWTSHQLPWMPHDEMVYALAAHHQVAAEAIVLGSGSTDVLRMVVGAAARDGGRLVVMDPTYEDVVTYAAPWDLEVVRVPLDAAYRADLGRMADAARRRVSLVYVANPSNPVGTVCVAADLERLIDEMPDHVTVVVDEAYHDYAVGSPDYVSVLPLTKDRPNLIVTRTFSKVHGMAGLRIGYGVANPLTAARLAPFRLHHNANHLSVYAALAALGDVEHVELSVRTNAEVMSFVVGVLDELGLAHVASHTNFVLHEIRGDVKEYVARMREEHIWVGRPFPPLDGHDRLSIGTRADMERFADTLRAFRRQGWV